MREQLLNLLKLRTTPPAIPAEFLDRPRLHERLTEATDHPLTLVCAGAGHGKTFTIASWIKQRPGTDVAWLSLDDNSNDPQAFWFDLLGALTINDVIPSDNPLRELAPAARFDVHAARLISAGIAALPAPVVLVLDDFNEITDDAVLQSLQWLLDHQPHQLRLIIATRADPRLRLQRRRVAGDLTDIRAGELAFTEDEAGKLLAGSGIHLTGVQLGALLDRTQGWAAGLRLAVLSFDPSDIDAELDRFTGDDGLVAEYLIEELLERIPVPDREFLLSISVVERVSASLAGHLTSRADSRQVLERLLTQNALLLGLAGESQWFGFHPMLRQLLLRRLELEQPDMVPELHRRAAHWFGVRGDAIVAIRHSSQAQDWELVSRLLATIAWPLALTPSGPALATALEPAVTVAAYRPTAHTLLAAAVHHYLRHDFSSMRRECDAAVKLLGDVPAADCSAIECLIGTLRIAHSRIENPADTAIAASQQLGVLERASGRPSPTAEHHRVIATNNLAVSQLWAGQFDQAASNLRAVQKRCSELGIGLTELNAHGHLALLDVIHGQLPAATQRAMAAMDIARRRGWASEPQVLGVSVAITMADLERWRFVSSDASRADLVDDTYECDTATDIACLVVQAIAAVYRASGQADLPLTEEADLHLENLQVRAGRLPPLLTGWCAAAHADADLAAGRWSQAIDRIAGVDPRSEFPSAIGRIVVAKARLQLDQPDRAIDALAPLLAAALRFRGPAVEARVLAAVAADRKHGDATALAAVTQAVRIAHSVGMIRPFLTAGPRVANLIDRHRHVVAKHLEFTAQLAAALSGCVIRPEATKPFLEPLTGREAAVLVYLPTMLKSAEIAADLYVSVNTVKSHQRAIYRKLGVSNRREAVDQARALNILGPPDRAGHARGWRLS